MLEGRRFNVHDGEKGTILADLKWGYYEVQFDCDKGTSSIFHLSEMQELTLHPAAAQTVTVAPRRSGRKRTV